MYSDNATAIRCKFYMCMLQILYRAKKKKKKKKKKLALLCCFSRVANYVQYLPKCPVDKAVVLCSVFS